MEELNIKPCACEAKPKAEEVPPSFFLTGKPLWGAMIVGLVCWYALYSQLLPFSKYATFDLLGLTPGTHLGEAVQFFIYDTPKVLMLLGVVVFGIGVIRSYVTVEWTRKVLAGRRESAGNVMAALLGVVTPFCSCSAVPLFIGFVAGGVPLGVTFSFLISAPMVNEVALVLLYGLMGWKVATLYFVTGVSIAIVAGWVIGRLKMEKYVESWVTLATADKSVVPSGMNIEQRVMFGIDSVKDIVGKVWLYVVLGIAAGAAIHGYVPEDMMASIMGKGVWWAVPVSVLLGIPMYTNAAGVIPIVDALLGKGAALGTVLAFMMSVIALSFPEMVILRKVLKPRLIAVFVGVVACGILMVGYLFNMII
ncbi:permease [Maridesulfovibrio hydrothermalis]|uniref:Permease n=1 Tax=Maridesulfovibrio hydrothermalis AM13 = DSM 14728 TaxID=1121451 RepID=L0R9P7_9BACT|nr:permease [Maridesulfovibrio hydrothermalis]CCO23469.1 Permease [Maridesulfovibrio hydrothermalis AM13 = DSM 14728]